MQKKMLFFLCLLGNSVNAQHLHTPAQIKQLMEKSSIRYEMDSLSQPLISSTDWPVLEEGWHKDLSSGDLLSPTSDLVTKPNAQKYQKKANKLFDRQKFPQAARFYSKAIDAQKGELNATLQKQLAQALLKTGKTLAAGEAIAPLMESYYSDFSIHVLLAQIYQSNQQYNLALQHISLAHLLNRNDPEVLTQLMAIYAENGLEFKPWDFRPQYQVLKTEEGVKISYSQSPWGAYGACRAMWQYEPEYATNMSRMSNQSMAYIQQKECLFNALLVFEQNEANQSDFPEFQALAQALPTDQIDLFILYEIDSRADPMVIFLLEKPKLLELVEFIKKYHAGSALKD